MDKIAVVFRYNWDVNTAQALFLNSRECIYGEGDNAVRGRIYAGKATISDGVLTITTDHDNDPRTPPKKVVLPLDIILRMDILPDNINLDDTPGALIIH